MPSSGRELYISQNTGSRAGLVEEQGQKAVHTTTASAVLPVPPHGVQRGGDLPPPIRSGISYNLRKISARSLTLPDPASRGSTAAPPRQSQRRPHPAQLGIQCSSRSAADTPERFFLALAPEFLVSQRAQTQPGPSRPRSRPFPPCAGGPGTWGSPVLPRPPCETGQRQDGASALWDCPRTVLRAVALSSHRPSPCPRRLWGTKASLRTPGISVVSAQPAHLNVLLVPSWHSLLPDRFLQSKHFGAKQLSSLSCSPDAPTDVSKKNRRAWKSG
ncbi:uncharacterized protein [Anomalospiza imberbis]|uniref:uncharacterized protein n=1 Tax=Anomalospiza imberbis TaxID=187417 RepID=UPI00358DFCE1